MEVSRLVSDFIYHAFENCSRAKLCVTKPQVEFVFIPFVCLFVSEMSTSSYHILHNNKIFGNDNDNYTNVGCLNNNKNHIRNHLFLVGAINSKNCANNWLTMAMQNVVRRTTVLVVMCVSHYEFVSYFKNNQMKACTRIIHRRSNDPMRLSFDCHK